MGFDIFGNVRQGGIGLGPLDKPLFLLELPSVGNNLHAEGFVHGHGFGQGKTHCVSSF